MKALLALCLLSASMSTFAQAANEKIAYCVAADTSSAKIRAVKYIGKTDDFMTLTLPIGNATVEASFRDEPRKLKEDTETEIAVLLTDNDTKVSAYAVGLARRTGRGVVVELKLANNSSGYHGYNATCDVIDTKYMEEHSREGLIPKIKRALEEE